jgi:hypothetical protein
VLQSNVQGTLTFATSGRDTPSTQLFIGHPDNGSLTARVLPRQPGGEGMAVVDSLFGGYGEAPPMDAAPTGAASSPRGTST